MQASLCTQITGARAPARAAARRPLAVVAALPDHRQALRSAGLAVAGCLVASQLLMAPASLAGEGGKVYKGVVPDTEKDQPAPSVAPLAGPSSGTDANNPMQKRATRLAAGDLEEADRANVARKGDNAGNPFSGGSPVQDPVAGAGKFTNQGPPLPTKNLGQSGKQNFWEPITKNFVRNG